MTGWARGVRGPASVVVVLATVAAMAATAATAGAAPLGHITPFSRGLQDNPLPGEIVAGPDGNLWFADPGNTLVTTGEGGGEPIPSNHGIGRITPQGKITEFFKGLQADGASTPVAIAAGADGALWFTDDGGALDPEDPAQDPASTTPAIGRITTSGAVTEFMTGLPKGSVPNDVAAGPGGNLWFTDQGKPSAIGTVTPTGQITEITAGLPAGAVPASIAKGPDGNMWFADAGKAPAIGRVAPGGEITEFPLHLGADQHPHDITAGPDGNLWFTVSASTDDPFGPTPAGAIGRVTPTGAVKLFSVGLPISVAPFDIAAGPDGALWFTDSSDVAPGIGRITTSGQVTEIDSAVGLAADSRPTGIVAGPDGNLWVTEDGDLTTLDDGVGIGIDRVDSAGASGVLTQPKFVLTCATKKRGGKWHCRSGLAGHATLARATGPVYQASIDGFPKPGHARVLTGTGRRIGSHLVITVSRLMRDDLIGAYPFLTLTHGHTHVHVGLIVDCQVCKVQD